MQERLTFPWSRLLDIHVRDALPPLKGKEIPYLQETERNVND